MSFTLNRNWVEMLKASLSDYASELAKNIESVMTDQVLDPVDAHACALAAALAAGNGELAFEISMSNELRGNDIREAVAKAVLFEKSTASYVAYTHAAQSERLIVDSSGFSTNDFTTNGGTTPEQFILFCFVAAIVNQCDASIRNNISMLKNYGVAQGSIQSAARIASVIPSVGKCLLL